MSLHQGGGRLDWGEIAARQEGRSLPAPPGASYGPASSARLQDSHAPRELLDRLLGMESAARREAIAALSDEERGALAALINFDWSLWARPKQLAPEGDWRFWVVLAGRGFGKTRTGAEWIRSLAEAGETRWATIVGPTREAVRKIMLRGPAGLLTISPPWFAPKYEPSKLLITWPQHPVTGVQMQARIYSAERPERLRGEQHEKVWADEVAAWPKQDAFEQIDMGLRLGKKPQMLITTTPRSTALMVDLVLGPKNAEGVRVPRADVTVTKGRSEENEDNLARGSIESMRSRYGETRLGRQELDAELLERTGAELFTQETINLFRVPGVPRLKRIVVAIDPTKSEEPGDECGIVVDGLGEDGDAYVIDDRTVKGSPHKWATAAVEAYNLYRADALVYEKNGLEKVEKTMKAVAPEAKWVEVHASDGKQLRAEPVSALYEQGRVHHVGVHALLEDEMVTWDPTPRARRRRRDGEEETMAPSPNRMDANVHGITHLLLGDVRAPLKLV